MLQGLTTRIETTAKTWARRRQGADPASGISLQRRRIYILPTRYGNVFAGVVFAMLLGSMNYTSSIGYAMTFLLAGLGLVVMHHCHNNLLALRVKFAGALPVFAGEAARFRIALSNDARTERPEIEVSYQRESVEPVDLAPGETGMAEVFVPTTRRGWLELDQFSLETRFPAGFFRAWCWIHMPARCLVYPQPAPPGKAAPPGLSAGSGLSAHSLAGDSDFYGLREATPSDSPRRIAWKAYARNEDLLAKEFSGADLEPYWLDWDSVSGLDVESKLSQLTRWCLDGESAGEKYGLRIPGTAIEPAHGDRHLAECLKALALYSGGAPA